MNGTLAATVAAFNASVPPGTSIAPPGKDGASTIGLEPPKSHWAQPIEVAPFYALPLRPGITFTYLGVAVDAGRGSWIRRARRSTTSTPPAK